MQDEAQETVPAAVEADGLVKVYRDFWKRPRVRAVDGFSLRVRRGEIFGLLGPNGSGKSTTIRLLLGLLRPTHGTVRLLGGAPQDLAVRRRLGYLPEVSCVYPYLTGRETLQAAGALFDLPAAGARRRAGELLTMVGLEAAADRRVGEYSKGMARRLGLAQALIGRPDLLILDEPTSGLDPIACRRVKQALRELAASGVTVLLSSHLLADVERLCDRVAILHAGRCRADGTLAELLRRPDEVLLSLPAVDAATLERLRAACRDATGAEPRVSQPSLALDDYFARVVGAAGGEIDGPSAGLAPFLVRDPQA